MCVWVKKKRVTTPTAPRRAGEKTRGHSRSGKMKGFLQAPGNLGKVGTCYWHRNRGGKKKRVAGKGGMDRTWELGRVWETIQHRKGREGSIGRTRWGGGKVAQEKTGTKLGGREEIHKGTAEKGGGGRGFSP